MKCPSCGSPMGLENKYCPYCGEPNQFAIEHQRDMDRFEVEYRNTQNRVFKRTEVLRRHGGNLIVMVLVLMALIVALVMNFKAWDIGYSIREKKVIADREKDVAVIQEFLESGEYGKFRGYYDANDVGSFSNDDYWAVSRIAMSYTRLIEYVSSLRNPSSFSDELSIEYAAEALLSIFTVEKEYNYKEEYLTEDKMVYIRDMQERAALIAKTFFGLTDETIEDIPNLSNTKLASLIEEGLGR